MGYSHRQKSIILLMVTVEWAIKLLSHFVFHITGVAVMALAIGALFPGTPTKNDLRPPTAPNQSYLSELEESYMTDLEISIGYIGDDVVALAGDENDSYAFIAIKGEDGYKTTLSSAYYGLITKRTFALNYGERQMVASHLAYHWTAIQDHHDKLKANSPNERNPALN